MAPAAARASAVKRLEDLRVRGILRQLAQNGQLVDDALRDAPVLPLPGPQVLRSAEGRILHWEPTADHYPRLKMHGGHLTSDNVRLAHRLCNRRDYEWRTRINAMLAKRMSLEEIADELNRKKVPTVHGTNPWTASSVRKAFVS